MRAQVEHVADLDSLQSFGRYRICGMRSVATRGGDGDALRSRAKGVLLFEDASVATGQGLVGQSRPGQKVQQRGWMHLNSSQSLKRPSERGSTQKPKVSH